MRDLPSQITPKNVDRVLSEYAALIEDASIPGTVLRGVRLLSALKREV